MQKADDLIGLMKQRTDPLIASDGKLQQFLMWVNEKSLSVKVPYKPAAVRAFYFALDRALSRDIDRALDSDLNRALDGDIDGEIDSNLHLAPDLALDRALVPVLLRALNPVLASALERALEHALQRALDLALRQGLQQLKTQLPDPNSDEKIFNQWSQANSQVWAKQLRSLMIKHRNIGHDWQFSDKQIQVLKQYYDANLLIVDCLNSDCNVTPEVRSHIEETLLLPIALIEKTGSCRDK
jgi:predicted NACHT family NTPase